MLQRRSGMLGTSDRARRMAALRSATEPADGAVDERADGPRGKDAPRSSTQASSAGKGAGNGNGHVAGSGRGKKQGRAAKGGSSGTAPPAIAAFRVVDGGPLESKSEKKKAAAKADELARQGAAVATLVSLFQSAGIKASESLLSETTPMSMPRFKRLVTQMPKIAEIVNQFQSPDMQREVLQALIRAFESEDADADDEHDGHGSHVGSGSQVGGGSQVGSGSHVGSGSSTGQAGRATNGQKSQKKKPSAPAFLDDAAAAALIGGDAGDDSSIHS